MPIITEPLAHPGPIDHTVPVSAAEEERFRTRFGTAEELLTAAIPALGVSVIPAPQPSPDQQIADALFLEIHRAVTDSFGPAAPESSKTFDHGRVERAISHYRRFIDAVSERIRSDIKETTLPGV